MAPGGEEDGCVAVLQAAGWGCRGDPRRGGMAAVAVAVTPVAARACHGCAAGPRGRCARSSALVWVDKRASEGAFSGLSRSARMSVAAGVLFPTACRFPFRCIHRARNVLNPHVFHSSRSQRNYIITR